MALAAQAPNNEVSFVHSAQRSKQEFFETFHTSTQHSKRNSARLMETGGHVVTGSEKVDQSMS